MTIISPPEILAGIYCQEDSGIGGPFQCGRPACAVVWHEKDKRAYPMCEIDAWHNVKNRGGRLLMTTDLRAVP